MAAGATVKPSLLFFKKFTENEAEEYNRIYIQASHEVEAKYDEEMTDIDAKLAKRGKAVSYTHLDVYKRQGLLCLSIRPGFYAVWMEYCTIGCAVGFCLCTKNFPYVRKQRKTICRFA